MSKIARLVVLATPATGVTADRGAAAPPAPGISDVDPAPLLQMGEAVDPDAIQAAHETIIEQRERLPVEGETLP